MEHFLICGSPSCRFVVDVRQARKPLRRSQSLLNECPECGSEWMASCPSCAKPLDVTWQGHRAHCAECHRQFHAPAAA
jgi:transcription elongation factor Elf1